mmetsp:Transcript_13584/g.31857  ORF Transcript_13584/g.31857 Transcript_13584/m.31857 type:complete len:89 (-) Transcript_13584:692-958(-)
MHGSGANEKIAKRKFVKKQSSFVDPPITARMYPLPCVPPSVVSCRSNGTARRKQNTAIKIAASTKVMENMRYRIPSLRSTWQAGSAER